MEISRARHRAELVTDDRNALRKRLEAVTGERISALEGVGQAALDSHKEVGTALDTVTGTAPEPATDGAAGTEKSVDAGLPERERSIDLVMDMDM